MHKPVNPIYNSKDPTVSSNSWGIRKYKQGNYYYWRTDSPVSYNYQTEPAFIDVLGSKGDGGRWKSELKDSSLTQAGNELTQAGVICIAAAGNSGQQLVNPDHPNYDNSISLNTTTPLYLNNFGSWMVIVQSAQLTGVAFLGIWVKQKVKLFKVIQQLNFL